MLALISCQIWLYFLQSFSLYVCGFICKGWVWEIGEELSFKRWISAIRDKLASSSREATREKAMCEAHNWKLKSHARLSSSRVFRKQSHPAKKGWQWDRTGPKDGVIVPTPAWFCFVLSLPCLAWRGKISHPIRILPWGPASPRKTLLFVNFPYN